MPIASLSSMNLPGWQAVLFIVLVLVFLLTGVIVTAVLLSRYRWPLRIVIATNESGKGYGISGRDKARFIGFGDGGEELLKLKTRKKVRVGYGKRIGPRQILFVIGEDGLWYQSSFSDFDKTLREIGLFPSSQNVRLSMASARKGLDMRLQEQSWLQKNAVIVGIGMLMIMSLVLAGSIIFSSKKQVEIAQINSQSLNASKQTQEATTKTVEALTILVNKLNQAPVFQNSGLVPNG